MVLEQNTRHPGLRYSRHCLEYLKRSGYMSGGLGIVKLLATECLRRFITQQHTSELALLRFRTDPSNRQPFPIKYAIIHTWSLQNFSIFDDGGENAAWP